MYKETKFYLFLLGLLGVGEFILAIPLVVDSFIATDWLPFVFGVGLLHAVTLMLLSTNLVEYYHKSTHYVGLIAMVLNVIPLVNFIPHIMVLIKILKDFNDIMKQYSKDLEKRKGVEDDYRDDDSLDFE